MDFEVDNDGNKILKKSSPSSITVIFADGVRSNLLSRAFDHFRLVLLAAEQTEKMEVWSQRVRRAGNNEIAISLITSRAELILKREKEHVESKASWPYLFGGGKGYF